MTDGQVFSAASVRGGDSPALHPLVEDILKAIPADERGSGHGRCGLAQCITQALNAGHDPTGAQAAAVKVRGSVSAEARGQPVGPCDSCVALEDAFEIDFVTAN